MRLSTKYFQEFNLTQLIHYVLPGAQFLILGIRRGTPIGTLPGIGLDPSSS